MAKKKVDEGRKESDRELGKLEKKLKKQYKEAFEEIRKTADEYFEEFAEEEEEKRKEVEAGTITLAAFLAWRSSKMLSGKKYETMVDGLAKDLTRRNRAAASAINKFLPAAYAINSNHAAYDVCRSIGINISFELVDEKTVERLMKKNPKLLPQKAEIKTAKDMRWNQQKIKSALTQGILAGDSNDKIAERLQGVTDMSASAAIRNARTMTTAAENAGRLDRYHESAALGIRIKKTWVATLDDRTRDAHALLDGQTVELDEPFDSILGPIMYPGDPDADPENVYNCRCTMIRQIEGFEHDLGSRDLGSVTADTYEEWKEQAEERARKHQADD